uniref:Reverse transcriptase domain-containing protein n=1 Tax=Rhabditophanes sp. KR3021 TaxID=114890 RepID=A0AC35TLH3_9BILA
MGGNVLEELEEAEAIIPSFPHVGNQIINDVSKGVIVGTVLPMVRGEMVDELQDENNFLKDEDLEEKNQYVGQSVARRTEDSLGWYGSELANDTDDDMLEEDYNSDNSLSLDKFTFNQNYDMALNLSSSIDNSGAATSLSQGRRSPAGPVGGSRSRYQNRDRSPSVYNSKFRRSANSSPEPRAVFIDELTHLTITKYNLLAAKYGHRAAQIFKPNANELADCRKRSFSAANIGNPEFKKIKRFKTADDFLDYPITPAVLPMLSGVVNYQCTCNGNPFKYHGDRSCPNLILREVQISVLNGFDDDVPEPTITVNNGRFGVSVVGRKSDGVPPISSMSLKKFEEDIKKGEMRNIDLGTSNFKKRVSSLIEMNKAKKMCFEEAQYSSPPVIKGPLSCFPELMGESPDKNVGIKINSSPRDYGDQEQAKSKSDFEKIFDEFQEAARSTIITSPYPIQEEMEDSGTDME